MRRIQGIRDPSLHRDPVRRFLQDSSAGEAVEALRLLMTELDRAGYRTSYQAVVNYLLGKRAMDYVRAGELYRAAFSAGYAPVRFLLLRAPPQLVAEKDQVLPDPELIDVPLGRRKAMAKGQERDLLLRLALDPSIPVVEILLQNARIVESDVVRVAARRPNLAEVLATVATHRRWNHRYEVQRAIVQNPYAPTAVAASFVPFLMGRHLLEIGRDARLHEGVRSAAMDITTWRKSRRAGGRSPAPRETRH